MLGVVGKGITSSPGKKKHLIDNSNNEIRGSGVTRDAGGDESVFLP